MLVRSWCASLLLLFFLHESSLMHFILADYCRLTWLVRLMQQHIHTLCITWHTLSEARHPQGRISWHATVVTCLIDSPRNSSRNKMQLRADCADSMRGRAFVSWASYKTLKCCCAQWKHLQSGATDWRVLSPPKKIEKNVFSPVIQIYVLLCFFIGCFESGILFWQIVGSKPNFYNSGLTNLFRKMKKK